MIETSNFFAVPVFATELEDFSDHKTRLLSRIETLREGGGIYASNQHAFHSERDFLQAEDESTRWLRESLLSFAKKALTPLIAPRATRSWELVLVSSWAIYAPKGGYLHQHNHFPSPWSGVFYLQAEHSEVKGAMDGKLELFCPYALGEVFGGMSGVPVAPRDGVALLFPGALQHTVHPHTSELPRVSISYNFAVRAKA